ncbi:MAG: preprotein translocase subunit YajC [Clostridia bacterium]|nr:preprotein translocase subunit YajC [Clostridia bacterium]
MQTSLLADTSTILTYVILVVFIVIIVVFFVMSSRSNKKKQKEAEELIDAVKPGNKVKTIGGICGIVVEVDKEENTFVLETGTELSGKSYLKFDKQAIYQTDAVVEKKDENSDNKEEAPAEASEEPFEETAQAAEQPAEEKAEEPAENTELEDKFQTK